jgi:hypothetical protein
MPLLLEFSWSVMCVGPTRKPSAEQASGKINGMLSQDNDANALEGGLPQHRNSTIWASCRYKRNPSPHASCGGGMTDPTGKKARLVKLTVPATKVRLRTDDRLPLSGRIAPSHEAAVDGVFRVVLGDGALIPRPDLRAPTGSDWGRPHTARQAMPLSESTQPAVTHTHTHSGAYSLLETLMRQTRRYGHGLGTIGTRMSARSQSLQRRPSGHGCTTSEVPFRPRFAEVPASLARANTHI